MKISKSNKKYIRANYKSSSAEKLAEKTGLSKNAVNKYLAKTDKRAYKKRDPVKGKLVYASIESLQDIKTFLRKNLDALAIFSVLIVVIYINSIGGDFVSDDIAGYVKNPQNRDLAGSIGTFNIHNITFALNYALFGENPVPLHIQNIGLHIINTILIFIFVSMLFSKRVAFFSTLLFAAHPTNVEAVSWISGRVYMYYSMVIFGTLNLFVIYRKSKKEKYLAASVGFFAVGYILTRSVWVLSAPLLVVIIDYFFLNTKLKLNAHIKTVSFFVVAALFFILDILGKYRTRVSTLETVYQLNPQAQGSTASMLERIPYTIFMTVKTLVFPKNLSLYHENEQITSRLFYIMAAVAIAYIATILIFLKKDKRVSGLLIFLMVTIGPTFSPVQVASFMSERYLYLGAIAFLVLTALVFTKIESKAKVKNLSLYLTIAVVLVFALRTVVRNNDWSTRKSFWEATARTSPNSHRVYNNLGDVYGLEGDSERSIEMFKKAIEINPNYADATHNLGNAYFRLGDFEKAEVLYKRAFELKPITWQSLHQLGLIEMQRENTDAAKEYFIRALGINPNSTQSQQALQLIETGSRQPEVETQ